LPTSRRRKGKKICLLMRLRPKYHKKLRTRKKVTVAVLEVKKGKKKKQLLIVTLQEKYCLA